MHTKTRVTKRTNGIGNAGAALLKGLGGVAKGAKGYAQRVGGALKESELAQKIHAKYSNMADYKKAVAA